MSKLNELFEETLPSSIETSENTSLQPSSREVIEIISVFIFTEYWVNALIIVEKLTNLDIIYNAVHCSLFKILVILHTLSAKLGLLLCTLALGLIVTYYCQR